MKKSLLLVDANEYLLLLLFVSATFFFFTSFACSNGGCQVCQISVSLNLCYFSISVDLFNFGLILCELLNDLIPKCEQILESCSAATDCAVGLYCGNCAQSGKTQPFCIRGQANVPTSIVSPSEIEVLITPVSFKI